MLYRTLVMKCCSYPNEAQHAPSMQIPIWSSLLYMLLTETLHIEDDVLKCQLGIPTPPFPPATSPVPLGGVSSSHSGLVVYPRDRQAKEYQSYSRRLATVRNPLVFFHRWH